MYFTCQVISKQTQAKGWTRILVDKLSVVVWESGYSVLSRVHFPSCCRSCRGLHFSWNEVTKQEEKQTLYKCLSSSIALMHSLEEKEASLHDCNVVQAQRVSYNDTSPVRKLQLQRQPQSGWQRQITHMLKRSKVSWGPSWTIFLYAG